MNTANEFTCSMFDDHLRAYIDDELPVNVRSLFIEHKLVCEKCAKKMQEMENLCSQLAGMKRVSVSPEFDFAMKLRIRREAENLQKPWYSVFTVVRENYSRILMIPAAAMILIAGVMFYQSVPNGTIENRLPEGVALQLQNGNSVDLVPTIDSYQDEQIDEVKYVLEKAAPGEFEQGVILSGRTGSDTYSSQQDLILISF